MLKMNILMKAIQLQPIVKDKWRDNTETQKEELRILE